MADQIHSESLAFYHHCTRLKRQKEADLFAIDELVKIFIFKKNTDTNP